jgi:glycosyltransferase involved in cell wall biosynthesis
MKIALISTRFPPYNVGGEEVYAKRVYDDLSKDPGNTVYNINNTFGGKYTDRHIINLASKNSLPLGFMALPNPNLLVRLWRAVDRIKPDVIHINNVHGTWSTEAFFVSPGIPKVFEVHDYALFCFNGGVHAGKICHGGTDCWSSIHNSVLLALRSRRSVFVGVWQATNFPVRNWLISSIKAVMVRQALRGVKIIICPGHSVVRVLKEFGIDTSKLKYLPYGLDLAAYEVRPLPADKVVGFVGRLEKIKGCHILLQAFAAVVKKIPEAELHIVGDGRDEDGLTKLVRDLGLQRNVKFLGRKTPDELRKFYPKIQFLVAPSIWRETPALVTYEAMASGRPVVASNIGDFPDLVSDGYNGLLFEPGQANELADKIVQLLSYPGKVRRLAKHAAETIKNYDIGQRSQKLLEIYQEAIS